MPGSQKDRPTNAWEPLFLFSKSRHYFYDPVAVMEPCTGNAHSRGSGASPKMPSVGSGIRNNDSFSLAVNEIVYARHRRDVWQLSTEPMSEHHFAAYPKELVRPCILAGTSEVGVCADCGAPYKRLVEKTDLGDWHSDQDMKRSGVNRNHQNGRKWEETLVDRHRRQNLHNDRAAARANGADHDHTFVPPQTIGWMKTCKCVTWSRRPATVLDPFAGSGTTSMVSEELNRRWYALDLGYQDIQKRRMRGVQKQLFQD
jgi:hypothetical protein